MTIRDKKSFTANYDGQPIKSGETMVPFPCTELDAEACVNKECIKTVYQGGKGFKVIYRAVPEPWAKKAKSALNLVQNEELGHYAIPNSVSIEDMQDSYELELAVSESAEEILEKKESLRESVETFTKLAGKLIDTNAKLGYAVLLVFANVKGKPFYERMRLTQPTADRVRHQAEAILHEGMAKFKPDEVRCYRSKYDAIYRKEALELLDEIAAMYI